MSCLSWQNNFSWVMTALLKMMVFTIEHEFQSKLFQLKPYD